MRRSLAATHTRPADACKVDGRCGAPALAVVSLEVRPPSTDVKHSISVPTATRIWIDTSTTTGGAYACPWPERRSESGRWPAKQRPALGALSVTATVMALSGVWLRCHWVATLASEGTADRGSFQKTCAAANSAAGARARRPPEASAPAAFALEQSPSVQQQ